MIYPSLWFLKDSNPHYLVRSKACYPLHQGTNCYPPEIRTPIKWTKTTCPAVRREGSLVGNVGFEPTTS
jgi:hypothetical protein